MKKTKLVVSAVVLILLAGCQAGEPTEEEIASAMKVNQERGVQMLLTSDHVLKKMAPCKSIGPDEFSCPTDWAGKEGADGQVLDRVFQKGNDGKWIYKGRYHGST